LINVIPHGPEIDDELLLELEELLELLLLELELDELLELLLLELELDELLELLLELDELLELTSSSGIKIQSIFLDDLNR